MFYCYTLLRFLHNCFQESQHQNMTVEAMSVQQPSQKSDAGYPVVQPSDWQKQEAELLQQQTGEKLSIGKLWGRGNSHTY